MKRQPIIWGIILLFLLSSITPIASMNLDDKSPYNEETSKPYLLSYNSYIDLSYDLSELNHPVPQMLSLTIPLTVEYWTNIPENFRILPYWFYNLFLFGQFKFPRAQIKVEVLNVPDWANIYITSPNLFIDIPFNGEGPYEINTNLVLLLYPNAPSVPYKIDIRATSEIIGRLNGFSFQESIEFTPQFYPNLYINFKQIIPATPNESIYIPFNVTNKGNSISTVRFELLDDISNWTPILHPPYAHIGIDDTSIFQLSLLTPSDFYGLKEINIRFISEKYLYGEYYNTKTYDFQILLYNFE